MSNYTKSTNFATKDNLSSGDPLKIVKGTEINTEFDNIQTAIATKADLASPTFTGTPSLPTGTTAVTQSSATNNTTLATTAFIQAALNALYPLGSIYFNSASSVNPATLLGFGTWAVFGTGRTIIGQGSGWAATSTGGSADAVVVSHTHTATSTDSGHTHVMSANAARPLTGSAALYAALDGGVASSSSTQSGNAVITTTVASAGVSGTNANLPPYIVVYMWVRTG